MNSVTCPRSGSCWAVGVGTEPRSVGSDTRAPLPSTADLLRGHQEGTRPVTCVSAPPASKVALSLDALKVLNE